jgi:hypothetical protein
MPAARLPWPRRSAAWVVRGVDLATYWAYPGPAKATGAAFRPAAGAGAAFGDLSLPVWSTAWTSQLVRPGQVDGPIYPDRAPA